MNGELFEGQHAGEKVEQVIHRHPIIFIGETILILILLAIGLGGVVVINLNFVDVARQVALVVMSFYFFFIWVLYLVFFVSYYFDITFLTNERLVEIAQKALFARDIAEITLDHVQNVSAKQEGLLQTVLDYGTVIVETAGESTGPAGRTRGGEALFELENIPKPNQVAKHITEFHVLGKPHDTF